MVVAGGDGSVKMAGPDFSGVSGNLLVPKLTEPTGTGLAELQQSGKYQRTERGAVESITCRHVDIEYRRVERKI